MFPFETTQSMIKRSKSIEKKDNRFFFRNIWWEIFFWCAWFHKYTSIMHYTFGWAQQKTTQSPEPLRRSEPSKIGLRLLFGIALREPQIDRHDPTKSTIDKPKGFTLAWLEFYAINKALESWILWAFLDWRHCLSRAFLWNLR